jgi:hypothetical protein
MSASVSFNKLMIAPCGINCGTCKAYLRVRNRCYGCREDFESKRKTCAECRIKNCDMLAKTSFYFCYECEIFPCEKMKHIDKRYRIRYRASLIQNLITIKEIGITDFLKLEEKKWTCPNCGATTSIHCEKCLACSYDLINMSH